MLGLGVAVWFKIEVSAVRSAYGLGGVAVLEIYCHGLTLTGC